MRIRFNIPERPPPLSLACCELCRFAGKNKPDHNQSTGSLVIGDSPFDLIFPGSIMPAACFVGGIWITYAYVVPAYEAPDEVYHFALNDYIAARGELPYQDKDTGKFNTWKQEGNQPPLYYLLAAALVKPLNRDDFGQVSQRNPHAILSYPGLTGNKNYFLHPQVYPPPLSGAILATFVVRGFSLILGVITIFGVYQTARTAVPDQPEIALLAARLTARFTDPLLAQRGNFYHLSLSEICRDIPGIRKMV